MNATRPSSAIRSMRRTTRRWSAGTPWKRAWNVTPPAQARRVPGRVREARRSEQRFRHGQRHREAVRACPLVRRYSVVDPPGISDPMRAEVAVTRHDDCLLDPVGVHGPQPLFEFAPRVECALHRCLRLEKGVVFSGQHVVMVGVDDPQPAGLAGRQDRGHVGSDVRLSFSGTRKDPLMPFHSRPRSSS